MPYTIEGFYPHQSPHERTARACLRITADYLARRMSLSPWCDRAEVRDAYGVISSYKRGTLEYRHEEIT